MKRYALSLLVPLFLVWTLTATGQTSAVNIHLAGGVIPWRGEGIVLATLSIPSGNPSVSGIISATLSIPAPLQITQVSAEGCEEIHADGTITCVRENLAPGDTMVFTATISADTASPRHYTVQGYVYLNGVLENASILQVLVEDPAVRLYLPLVDY